MRIQGLQILAEEMIERGFLIETRPTISKQLGRSIAIEIGNTSALDGEELFVENSINHYLNLLKQDRVSWILCDGSIVQIYYKMKENEITMHRYCYIPAPFEIDMRGSENFSDIDIIEASALKDPLNVSRRTTLRFEFDPQAQTDKHPAAHLHINSSNCRIPMRAAITVKEFIFFIIDFFYNDAFSSDAFGVASFSGIETITEKEQEKFHISWQRFDSRRL